MLNNLSAETREWCQQAVNCARQADAQTDPLPHTHRVTAHSWWQWQTASAHVSQMRNKERI